MDIQLSNRGVSCRIQISPVCEVEGLLNAIAMMDVNIDIQHTRMHLEQLQNGQHKIVDVAESCVACSVL